MGVDPHSFNEVKSIQYKCNILLVPSIQFYWPVYLTEPAYTNVLSCQLSRDPMLTKQTPEMIKEQKLEFRSLFSCIE